MARWLQADLLVGSGSTQLSKGLVAFAPATRLWTIADLSSALRFLCFRSDFSNDLQVGKIGLQGGGKDYPSVREKRFLPEASAQLHGWQCHFEERRKYALTIIKDERSVRYDRPNREGDCMWFSVVAMTALRRASVVSVLVCCTLGLAWFPVCAADSKPPTHREDPSGSGIRTEETITVNGIRGPEFFNPGLSVVDTTRNVDSTELRLNDGGAQATDDKKANDKKCPKHGNPIILATGNKTESELDFTAAGEMPLQLRRVWNQHWDGIGLFGYKWVSSFDYRLSFGGSYWNATCYARPSIAQCSDTASAVEIWAHKPDGRKMRYLKAADGVFYEDKASPVSTIIRQSDGTWALHGEEDEAEVYSAGGYPVSVKNAQGVGWIFSHGGLNGTQLQRVTHSSGRYVQLVWSGDELVEIQDPIGNAYRYSYTQQKVYDGMHLLASTTLAGAPATVLTYHYSGIDGEPDYGGYALTGKSYNGVRYSRFSYTSDGDFLATSTQHAGGVESHTYVYQFDTSGALDVTETNPLGKQAIYKFNPEGQLLEVTGVASTNCPASGRSSTFDANGNPDQVLDFKGNFVDFDYSAKGRLTRKVEAQGRPEARTTVYTWDPVRTRIDSVTVEGLNRVDYVYNTGHRLSSVSMTNLSSHGAPGQSRTTTYSYTSHANGLLATITVDGPLSSDTVTQAFNVTGDLIESKNGLGHATTYTNYNALGQPGRVTGPNGDVTEFIYDARGRLVARKAVIAGVSQATTYTYDGFGRLSSVQAPDGRLRTFEYDAAWRIAREYENEPAGTYAVKRYTYNNASLVTSAVTERTTAVHPPVSTPTLTLPATGADGSYSASWTAVAGAESYFLSESYNGGPWVASYIGPDLAKAFTGRPAGIYHHGITACNAAGCAAWSPATAIHVIYRPSGAPLLTAPAQSTSGSYTVSWAAISGASSYRLEEGTAGGWTLLEDGAATSKLIVGKNAGTYSYRATACNAAGCGPVSAIVTVTEVDPPGSPPSVFAPAVNANGSYTVSWTAVGGSSSYQLEESVNAGPWMQMSNDASTSRAFSGKPTHVDHAYRVRACNTAGCGAISAAATVQHVIYGAQYVAQSVPSSILPGQTIGVSVQMRNTGNAPWTNADAYRLGSQSPVDNSDWGLSRVAVSGSVAPGEVATFTFNIIGPASDFGQTRYFQWRMVRDGVTWFGDPTPFTGIWLEGPDPNNCGGDPNCHQN
nr:DUF6531 domain-containing protein [Lysobacter sp. ESA13C]